MVATFQIFLKKKQKIQQTILPSLLASQISSVLAGISLLVSSAALSRFLQTSANTV
jgi:hypothetical protein